MKLESWKIGLLSLSSLAFALFFAGCVEEKEEELSYDAFEPKPALAPSKPGAYSGYGAAMAKQDGRQMAYEWQKKESKAVEEATRRETLAAFVLSPKAADALLAKIGTTYDGDPVVLTQIAAVTQLVMTPDCPKAKSCRKVWVAALKRARAATDDGYVSTFCNQQLRLCR